MNRSTALVAIKVAGYHNDAAAGTRIYLTHKISRDAYNKAFWSGQDAKKAGVKCNCMSCKREAVTA